MDDPIPLRFDAVLAPLGLDVPPCGETSFDDLTARWREALASSVPGPALLRGAASMAEVRAFAMACREAGRPFALAVPCDEDGETPAGADVLALLIVLEGLGAAVFGLCAPADIALPQLERLVPYASLPLFYDDGEERRDFPYQAVPRDPDVIPCAGSKRARFITPDVDVGEPLECSPDLLEDILRAEAEPVGAIKLEILEPDDLDVFAAHQYAVEKALCLWSDVPELLEGALRLYQGRAFYDGTGDLERSFLAEMTEKYGLVVL